jgi:hypothetical protein
MQRKSHHSVLSLVSAVIGIVAFSVWIPVTHAGPVPCPEPGDLTTSRCCEVCGPDEVCPGETGIAYTANAVADADYDWEISGDARFQDGGTEATGRTVYVDADEICGGSFILQLTITVARCEYYTCCFEVYISDEPPTIICPPCPELECGVPWEFCIRATDYCDDVEITCEVCDLDPPGADELVCLGGGRWSLIVHETCSGRIRVHARNLCGESCCYIPFSATCPPPGCVIRGPDEVCPGQSEIEFTAEEVPDATAYNWVISGDAAFCEDGSGVLACGEGAATGRTVCVDADAVCRGWFVLQLTVEKSRCPITCEKRVRIVDEPPIIECPIAPELECGVPWEFCITATGDCDENVEITAEISELDPPDADELVYLGDNCWRLTVNETCTGRIRVRASDLCGESCCYIPFSATCAPPPECVINGPDQVCPGETEIEFTADEVPDATAYNWVISGDALFCDGQTTATGMTVCVDADLVCPGSFALQLTVELRSEVSPPPSLTCEKTVQIYEEPPLIGCPIPPELECSMPWEFCITATDNCDESVEITAEISDLEPPDAGELVSLGDNCWSLTLNESSYGQIRVQASNLCGENTCYIDFAVVCGGGTQGCGPGYWQQEQHFDNWVDYAPSDLFSSVFDDAFPDMTLLEVLEQGGGGLTALGRQTVAALLNSTSGIDYPLTTQQVIDMFNAVYPGGDYEGLKDLFELYNTTLECPLNGDGQGQGQGQGHGCGPLGLLAPLLTFTGLLGMRLRAKPRRAR